MNQELPMSRLCEGARCTTSAAARHAERTVA